MGAPTKKGRIVKSVWGYSLIIFRYSGIRERGCLPAPSIPPVSWGLTRATGYFSEPNNLNLPFIKILVNTFRSEGAPTHRKGFDMPENQRTVLHTMVEFMRLPQEERDRQFRQTVIAIGKGIQIVMAILAAFSERMPNREISAISEAKNTPTLLAKMANLEESHGDWNRKDWYP